MIALLGASVLMLGLQASIEAPTSAFRGCLHDAAAKATSSNVNPDGIEGYLRDACTVQMGTLKQALVDFRIKNGMTRKAAADDAEMTIDDYVSTPADNYKFVASEKAKSAAPPPVAAAPASPATTPATPAATPASQPTSSQPHNP